MAIKKSDLYSSLWQSCDELRGGMDASQYKDYVLVLLFVKYISDKYAGQHYLQSSMMKKRLNLQHSLYEILRVLDLKTFEIVSIADIFGQIPNVSQLGNFPVQQDLFQTLGH